MSADLAALADEALYAEQWLLQGQPVGSLTPEASKMREIEAALRAIAAADEKMPVVGGRCKACNEVGASHCSDPVNCAGMVNHVRQSDAQAAVLAAVAAERQRIEREVMPLLAAMLPASLYVMDDLHEIHNAILRAIRGELTNPKEPT